MAAPKKLVQFGILKARGLVAKGQFSRAEEAIERSAQLMRDEGQEVVFSPVQEGQLAVYRGGFLGALPHDFIQMTVLPGEGAPLAQLG